jgi:hypothetical protein
LYATLLCCHPPPQFEDLSRSCRRFVVDYVGTRRGPKPWTSQWQYGTRCKWQWDGDAFPATIVWNSRSFCTNSRTQCTTKWCYVTTEFEPNCRYRCDLFLRSRNFLHPPLLSFCELLARYVRPMSYVFRNQPSLRSLVYGNVFTGFPQNIMADSRQGTLRNFSSTPTILKMSRALEHPVH